MILQTLKKRVLIAGTYNAHPLNAAAAIATLGILGNPAIYKYLASMSSLLYEGLAGIFKEKGVPAIISSNASAFCPYFCEKIPQDLHDILENHDFEFNMWYRKALIENGIYNIPIACKQGSISYSHSAEDIQQTLDITRAVVKSL